VKALLDEANRLGLVTKRRQRRDGRQTGGRPFSRGNLYQLLANPIYVGQVSHKGTPHPGQHEAVIDRETFEAVGRQLASNASRRRSASNARAPSLLSGLVFDERGDRLCPTHANKKGHRYRYYISKRLMHRTRDNNDGWRVPADELESAISRAIWELLRDRRRIVEELKRANVPVEWVQEDAPNPATILAKLEDRQTLQRLLHRVTLCTGAIRLEIKRSGLVSMVSGMGPESGAAAEGMIEHTVPVQLRRRGVETRLVLRGPDDAGTHIDDTLVAYVVRTHRWFEELAGGTTESINEIAARDGINASDVGRSLQFAFLAPDIVEAVLAGRQPVELTARRLHRIGTLPTEWDCQRRLLGFEPWSETK
jgi:hypothetical protein